MTFTKTANLLDIFQVSCACLLIAVAMLKVFRGGSKATLLKGLAYILGLMLLAGMCFATYYTSKAPQHLNAIAKNDPKQAVVGYTAAIRLNPDNAELYLRRGVNRLRLKQYAESINDFSKALESAPGSPKILSYRAQSYFFLGNYDRSRTDIQRAAKAGHETPEMLMLQGVLASQAKDFTLASRYYTQVLNSNVDPENRCYALINRADSYVRRERFPEALEDINTALSDCRSSSQQEDALVDRGVVYKLMGKFDLALQDWDAAEKINPNDAVIYKNRGGLMIELGRREQALANFQKYVGIRSDDAFGYNKLAEIYTSLGDKENAVKQLKVATQLLDSGMAKSYPSLPIMLGVAASQKDI
jgi:tetratricopeptide (TPR) repeat protein